MVILGVDPGTAHTGYGVVLARGQRLVALDGGVIATGTEWRLEQRLVSIHARLRDLLATHRPAALALARTGLPLPLFALVGSLLMGAGARLRRGVGARTD